MNVVLEVIYEFEVNKKWKFCEKKEKMRSSIRIPIFKKTGGEGLDNYLLDKQV